VPKFTTPLEDDKDRLDAVYGDTPVHYWTMTNILDDQALLAPVQRNLDIQLHLTHACEPATHAEAEWDLVWRAAMKQGLKSIKQNHT